MSSLSRLQLPKLPLDASRDRIVPLEPIWEQVRKPVSIRAINAVGSGLRRCGIIRPKLDPERLIARAERLAGLTDFGGDSFREGLDVLVAAFNRRGSATTFGRMVFRQYVTGLLVGRLKIEDELTRHPEILEAPVRRPLFITGMPRSGTTLLHRLLSVNPAGRPLLYWEVIASAPAPEPATYRTDPRIARMRQQIRQMEALSPQLAVAHETEAESPEEDNTLYARDFVAPSLGFLFDVPDYLRWLSDQTPARLRASYRYARRQLQLLSWKVQGEHWVLKSPMHQYSLDALVATYPDAQIIVTHRDPRAVVPSLCSLALAVRGIAADRVDLRAIGAEFVQAVARGTTDVIKARRSLDPARLFDVGYDRLIADPIGTIHAAAAHFGTAVSPTFEANARAWLAANPQHRRGVHRYRLENFGLDPRALDRSFAPYRDWLRSRPDLGVKLA